MEALTQETSGTETAFIGKNVPFRTRVLSFTRRFMHTNIYVGRKKCSAERRELQRQPTPTKPPKKWLCGDQKYGARDSC